MGAAAALLCGASGAWASVAVTNYNWLQLPNSQITVAVTGAATANTNGYGVPVDFRWAARTWIPSWDLTGTKGTGTDTTTVRTGVDYTAAVQFTAAARNVSSVLVEPYVEAGHTTLTKFHIDGFDPNTSTWTNDITTTGLAVTNSGALVTVPVNSASYQAIRIRVAAGDYTTTGGGAYGGPGFTTIAPIGSGTAADSEVNRANKTLFNTVASSNFDSSHGYALTGTTWNDAGIYDSRRIVGSDGNYVAGDYMQLDLTNAANVTTSIAKLIILDEGSYGIGGATISTSTDGTLFTPVSNQTLVNDAAGSGEPDAHEFNFDAVNARYVRITNATNENGYTLVNQVLVYAPASVPEPASIGVLGLGGLLLLRRRQRP